MNAVFNETESCYCRIRDKIIYIIIESKYFNSKTHKHKERYGIVVEEHEFTKQKIDEIGYILVKKF